MNRKNIAMLLMLFFLTGISASPAMGDLPQSLTWNFNPPEGAGEAKVEYIAEYETDHNVKKYDVGVFISARWHEKAHYMPSIPAVGSWGHQLWEYTCDYESNFLTRIYEKPQGFGKPPRIYLAKTYFSLYPRRIAGYSMTNDMHNERHLANNIKILVPAELSAFFGTDTVSPGSSNETFDVHLNLSAGIFMPTAGQAMFTQIQPFIAVLESDMALHLSMMSEEEKKKAGTIETTFGSPIEVKGFSMGRITEGPLTLSASDRRSGGGVLGSLLGSSGNLECDYEVKMTIYLKGARGDYGPYGAGGSLGSSQAGSAKAPDSIAAPAAKQAKPAKAALSAAETAGAPAKEDKKTDDAAKNESDFADKVMELYKGRDYAAIYGMMSEEAQSSMPRDRWMEICNTAERSLGNLRRYTGSGAYANIPGDYTAEVEYYAEFAKADGAVTIVIIKKPQGLKLRSFIINSIALENGRIGVI